MVTRDLPVLREVFGGAARFAADPAGFARELRAALVGTDPAPGRALARRYPWAAAAEAHRNFYRSSRPGECA